MEVQPEQSNVQVINIKTEQKKEIPEMTESEKKFSLEFTHFSLGFTHHPIQEKKNISFVTVAYNHQVNEQQTATHSSKNFIVVHVERVNLNGVINQRTQCTSTM